MYSEKKFSNKAFLEYSVKCLIENTAKRKKIEEKFDRSKMKVYEEVCESQLLYAAEVLSIGVKSKQKDGKLCIYVDNENVVEINESELIESVGKEEYERLLDKSKYNFLDYEQQSELQEKHQQYVYDPNTVLTNYTGTNPFSIFLPMLAQSLQPYMQQAPTTHREEHPQIRELQEQIKEMEEAKGRDD